MDGVVVEIVGSTFTGVIGGLFATRVATGVLHRYMDRSFHGVPLSENSDDTNTTVELFVFDDLSSSRWLSTIGIRSIQKQTNADKAQTHTNGGNRDHQNSLNTFFEKKRGAIFSCEKCMGFETRRQSFVLIIIIVNSPDNH